jgi:cyclophilin family peptidyl-prolyl cis-trans isomerase
VAFIVVMIASLAATGLAPGLGGSTGSNSPAPIIDEGSPVAVETPTGLDKFPDGPQKTIDATKPHVAIIATDKGNIEIALNTDAPEAVNSFAYLAGAGFYDDLVFFYVDQEFVAQAGDPTCNTTGEHICSGSGGPGYSLDVEESQRGHEQWAVVAPATATGQKVHGSQFRILLAPEPDPLRLEGKETVFGTVMEGQDILADLGNFVPCSVVETDGCDADPDMSSVLVIKSVVVQPA